MGRPHCRCSDPSGQDIDRPLDLRRPQRRSRCCLLKGCERRFFPSRPQARYCSTACQQAARRWRRWHAAQRYRASANGHERRRDQSRRYRQRLRQRPVPEPAATMPPPAAAPPAAVADAGEGQRPAEKTEKSCGCPCQRPGCYDCFGPAPHAPAQRFCSAACRQALRRVEHREARLRQRRRHGIRPRRVRRRPPP